MDTSTTDSQALPAGTRLEEFIIERVLGAGGFGITYLARDVSLNRQVVIKENLPTQFAWRETATGTVRPRHTSGGDADDYEWSMNNFLREAETLASLDHHGIVRVLRKFETNGTAYFVMPFVDGVALDTLIEDRRKKNSPFSEEELRGLLERMLNALAYLHDRGIYHRDIKPGNILISNDGVPALIDFGSARQRLSERSMTVVESAGYTPFEQLQSRGNVGPWSDLYALGATLVKAITFESLPKAADRVIEDPWPGLASNHRLSGRYSVDFLTSIEQSVAPSLAQRWQDARQWKHYLQTGMPVSVTADIPQPPQPVTQATGGDSGAISVAPALWNPNTAAVLSFILIPLVAVFLHARNARALGMSQDEKRNMWWFYGLALLIATTMLFSGVSGLIKLYPLAYLVWYFTSARKQERLVKAQFGKNYPRKNLFPPFLIGFGCQIAAIIFIEGLHSITREEADQSLSGEVASPDTAKETSEDLAVTYFNRGLEYANGNGVAQNHEEAVKWYRKAAELGQISAMNNLGACYADGQGVPKDVEEAAKWYRKAAELGSSIGQCNLGYAYARGEGVLKNIETAIGWFRKSAMQGDAPAQYMLGLSYTGVEGIPEDLPEAAKWFQKSADLGFADAQYMLADCFVNGSGVAKDQLVAVKWFQKSAEQGHKEAQELLGSCYLAGDGVAKNPAEAVKWFRKAAEQNSTSAQNSLGDCYKNGVGVAKDAFEAVKWYRAAAELGDADAQFNLAIAHVTGSGAVKDAPKAFELFQKAANQDLAAAQYFLGVLYQSGEGVTKDVAKALEWFTKSASHGYPDAQYELGIIYGNGSGAATDHAVSVKWYRQAADQGHAGAQTNLGVAYANGEGVPKDLVSAYMWTHLATSTGEEQAKKNLEIFAAAMTGQQVGDALKQAKEWEAKKLKDPFAGP